VKAAPQIAAALRAIADALEAERDPAVVPAAAHTLLTYAQVAVRLGVNVSTARRLGAQGELKEIRVGAGTVRVREADLDEFIRSKVPKTA
jgi:excisionase family DNA binding protein